MKILAMSDTGFAENSIREYQRIVDSSNPDVIVMAGDYDEGEAFFLSEERKLDYFYEFLEYGGNDWYVVD